MARSRSRSFTQDGGEVRLYVGGNLNSVQAGDTNGGSESCVDEDSNPGVDHPFTLDRQRINMSGWNGVQDDHWLFEGTRYTAYRSVNVTSRIGQGHLSPGLHFGTPTLDDRALVLSRTNPSRPVVSPLMWAQNLKELPRMVRDLGQLLGGKKPLTAAEAASQHLAYQFGWAPLVDDLGTLLDVQSYITRRVRELERLYSKGGLKRRLRMGEQMWEEESYHDVSPLYSSAQILLRRKTVNTRWATVRWKPTVYPSIAPSSEDLNRKARQVVLGLTPEALVSGAWDLIPWSWLIDWFVPVGDHLSTWSNTVPASPGAVCIMRKTVTTSSVTYTVRPGWLDVGEASGEYTSLRRDVDFLPSTGRLPFLNGNRMSVLGSLFVQRFMR